MTSTQPSIEIPEQTINKTNAPPSFQAHMIEVSLNDLDFDLILCKRASCAVLPAYNDEAVIGSVVLRTKQYISAM